MARPKGDFQRGKKKLYDLLTSFEATQTFWGGNTYLCDKLGVGRSQLQKYLKALIQEGYVKRKTTRYKRDGRFECHRTLAVTGKVWEEAAEVVATVFKVPEPAPARTFDCNNLPTMDELFKIGVTTEEFAAWWAAQEALTTRPATPEEAKIERAKASARAQQAKAYWENRELNAEIVSQRDMDTRRFK